MNRKKTIFLYGISTLSLFILGFSFCSKPLSNSYYDDTKKTPANCLYTLSVCSVFKDEAPYFKEWIEYYKLMGVQHFRLYNNESTDNYLEVLKPYIDAGEVTLIDWPSDPKRLGSAEWPWYTQLPACTDAIVNLSGISEWLAIIDLDEFIIPFYHTNLISFLKEYEPYAGVLINWQNFGTSSKWEIPTGKLMIETLTLRAKENSTYNHPVKSIVRPDRVDINTRSWCPHTWSYLSKKDKQIFPNKKLYKFGVVEVSRARINHYVHKTESYFYNSKILKKERMEGCKLSQKYINDWRSSCNQEEDLSIMKFVPSLKERVFPKEQSVQSSKTGTL